MGIVTFLKDFGKYYLRNGKLFDKYLAELEEAENYSSLELKQYQEEKLKRIVNVAYKHIPFYRRVFQEKKLVPNDIQTIEDLQKLPIIDKGTVRAHFKELKNNNHRGIVNKGRTSGTTGTPSVFLRDMESINLESAAIIQHQRWANVRRGDKRVFLRGERVVPIERDKPPFWRFNRFKNQLIMSSYHLAEQYLPYYVRKIKEFSPKILEAYPSTAYILVQYLEKMDDSLDIPVVHTSSEPLYPHWRKLIENRLNAKIFDWYGMAERVCFAGECEAHVGLHTLSGYGITEFVKPSTNETDESEGVIVGTTLNNFIMPLIRYRTNDLSNAIKGSCTCGRKYPRIHPIETKYENIIITPDGKYISPSLLTFCFKSASNVEMSQIVQSKDGSIKIRIVGNKSFREQDRGYVISGIRDILGDNIQITAELVENIERTKGGKFQWIISEVNQRT
jgi:phenylacetate-CoA ligase